MRDVIVIGGGPGGSVCASRLASRGLDVLLLEKVRFPRFHLGESLLPQSLPELDAIGVLPKIHAAFLPKYGARFHDDIAGRVERFAFASAWIPEPVHAFQVPRDAFDHVLLEHARSLGADVREEWIVQEIVHEGGRAVGVVARDPNGTVSTIPARFIVDASGRDALTARAGASTTKIEGLDQTALFNQYRGVPRQEGLLEGDIDIVLFPSGEPSRPNWFWFIPFNDGRTSVGAVVSLGWMREARARFGADPTKLLDHAIAASPTATRLLADATALWTNARATADFSYRVGAMQGPGWIAVGDAGGFIDPLFSTGAHLAMAGARRAADAVLEARQEPAREAQILSAWEESVRTAAETFILAVRAFYAGPLVDTLFAPDKHTALRRSITSLLAGDVFGDAVWLRDTRRRLRDALAPQVSF
jgi:flavin-dependent dehydrogenase